MDPGCGGMSWWVQGVEACHGGCRVWRHVVVGAGCGGMSWWVQGVEACRGGCRVWRRVVCPVGSRLWIQHCVVKKRVVGG